MEWYYVVAMIIGGLIWLIGSGQVLDDIMTTGKTLKEYRNKYGHDLGLFICTTYRSSYVVAWPIISLLAFFVGLVRDTIKLVFGKKVVELKDLENTK